MIQKLKIHAKARKLIFLGLSKPKKITQYFNFNLYKKLNIFLLGKGRIKEIANMQNTEDKRKIYSLIKGGENNN